jgi:hypothetical protein
VSGLKPSQWTRASFGAAAADLTEAVTLAIHQAHALAMAAHISSTLRSNDAYGATLRVAQYEQLVEHARDITGISVRKPTDVRCRFDLVVNDDPPVVLYPLRYATDPTKDRERARLHHPVSELRKTLLTLNTRNVERQLTLDQALADPDQLDAELAEEEAMLEELASLGKVATVGFGSNPAAGIFGLGWGEIDLVNAETGEIVWLHWEDLPGTDELGGGMALPPITSAAGTGRTSRFDDAPLADDLGLTLRPLLGDPPGSDPQEPRADAGTGDRE